MKTLKRQRPNFEPEDRGQKRTCSNQPPSNLVQYEKTTQFQVPRSPPVRARFIVPKRCIHKIVTACNLTQATCCACLDARPDGLKFLRYLDGRAWELADFRWQYYCAGCQGRAPESSLFLIYTNLVTEHWSVQHDLGRSHRRPLGLTDREGEVPDAIRITYRAGGIEIIRSMDLTLDDLKAEVARLMQCDPRQLTMSDVAIYNREAVPGMSDDDALVLRATHISFKSVTNADPEDVEMEDVQASGMQA